MSHEPSPNIPTSSEPGANENPREENLSRPAREISHDMLNQLLTAAPIAIVVTDTNGRIRYANARLGEMFGYDQAELIDHPIEILIPERFRGDHKHHRADYQQHPRTRPMGSGLDLAGRHRDGTEFPVEVGLSHITLDGEMVIMGSVSDISKRKQTEEILEQRVEERTRELERRRKVADGLRDILSVLNSNQPLDETLDYIAAQACRLLYASASAICRRDDEHNEMIIQASHSLDGVALGSSPPLPEHTAINAATQTDTQLQLTLGNQATKEQNHLQSSANATSPYETASPYETYEVNYQAVLNVPLILKEETYGSLMLYYDEPRQFSAEEIELANTVGDQTILAIENARLRTQAERTAVAAERSRIARDLHDSVTQTLFSASLIAEVLPRLWDHRPGEALRRLDELRQLTRGALAEMRTLLLELRPATLTEVELAELLRQLTEAITGRARVPIDLQVDTDHALPSDVKVAFYHIAQEALNNVAKHSHATRAKVQLSQEGAETHLSVSDDGRGFIIERVTPEHLGLSIMHERAEAIGARLDVHSRLEHGTEITVTWTPPA